jgi:hypothetical protein
MSGINQREISVHWRLCDELSVKNAALLTVGVDPASEAGSYCEGWKVHERPYGYEAAKHAISNALRKGKLVGSNCEQPEHDFNGNEVGSIPGSTDIDRSLVDRDSLVFWLKSRGISSGFFFPVEMDSTGPEYLNPQNPRYSPKLAAAVLAWESATEVAGKTPKQVITAWLKAHAGEYSLCDEDGNHRVQAIDEIAKVANWLPGGGAPKTPG